MTSAPQTARATAAPSLTPTGRQWWRRARVWILIGAGALVIALAGALITSRGADLSQNRLDPESPAPAGAKALVQVLEQQGIDVALTDSLSETRTQVATGDTTVVVHDATALLDATDWQRILNLHPARIVVLQPNYVAITSLDEVLLMEGSAASGSESRPPLPAGADCPDPLATDAPAISAVSGIELAPAGDAHGCYSGSAGYAVVEGHIGTTEVVGIGTPDVLSNATIVQDSNAAMALGLLGDHPNLVWYVPGPDDAADSGPSYASFVPEWLTPVIMLALAGAAATMLWRGRRFGPLVTERLPVTVPANETLEGRARLYADGRSRLRSADSLRIGALSRIAATLGLPSSSSAIDVSDAAAPYTGYARDQVRSILLGAEPADDAQLVDLAAAIARIEADVRSALSPSLPPESASPSADDATTRSSSSAHGRPRPGHEKGTA